MLGADKLRLLRQRSTLRRLLASVLTVPAPEEPKRRLAQPTVTRIAVKALVPELRDLYGGNIDGKVERGQIQPLGYQYVAQLRTGALFQPKMPS